MTPDQAKILRAMDQLVDKQAKVRSGYKGVKNEAQKAGNQAQRSGRGLGVHVAVAADRLPYRAHAAQMSHGAAGQPGGLEGAGGGSAGHGPGMAPGLGR